MNIKLSIRALDFKGISSALIVIIFFAVLFWDLVPEARTEPLTFLPGLIIASIVFFAVGKRLGDLVRIESFNGAFAIVLGQVFFILYLYARSGLSELCDRILGFPMPVTRWEIWAIAIVTVVSLFKRFRLRQFDGSYWFCLLVFVLLIAIQRELPRELMLSSDPDQHLYFANQILRLGRVPWHQGLSGPEPFGYPSGFASLVAVWSWLSFVGPSNILPIQPLVQTSLALLLLMGFSEVRERLQLLLGLALFALFFVAYPYGFESSYFHQEVTGRISALGILSLSLFSLCFTNGVGVRTIALASAVVLAFINPALCVLPIFLILVRQITGIGAPSLFWRAVSAGWMLMAFFVLLLFEPYYTYRVRELFFGGLVQLLEKQYPVTVPANVYGISNLDQKFIDVFFVNYFSSVTIGVLFLAVIFGSFFLLRRKISREAWSNFSWLTTGVFFCWLFCTPIFSCLGLSEDIRLLNPYFQWAIQQAVIILIFYTFSILIAAIVDSPIFRRTPLAFGLIAVIGLISGVLLRRTYGVGDFIPRYALCGGTGCLTENDRPAMKFLEDKTFEFLRSNPNVTFENIPKILIANAPARMAAERRLLPTGGARVLPLREVFPVAFYYSQGSKDYSYKNYMDRVCRKLDLAWLQERKIQYLFLPEVRDGICVRGLTRLLKDQNRILFKNGDSIILSLSRSLDDKSDVGLHDVEENSSVSNEEPL